MGAALGHQHPRIVKIINTMKSLLHATNTMLHVHGYDYMKLGKILPKPLEKSVFLVSGSDSIEGSVDLARRATGGLDIIGLHTGLHGSTSYITFIVIQLVALEAQCSGTWHSLSAYTLLLQMSNWAKPQKLRYGMFEH